MVVKYIPSCHVISAEKYKINNTEWLTFGLVVLPGGSPPDAGLVLVQVKESDQSFLLPLQLAHLSAGLHGAHAPLHCRRAQGGPLCIRSQVAVALY